MNPPFTFIYKKHISRMTRILGAMLLFATLLLPALGAMDAQAAPSTTKQTLPVTIKDLPVSTKSGKDLSFAVGYTLPNDSTWSSFEIRLKNQDGKTVKYHEGWVGPQDKGTQTYDVTFALSGSNLPSQVYTVDATVRAKVSSNTLVGNANGVEPIYRTKEPKTKLAFCVRLETQIFTNANGEFVVDPATDSHQVDEVQRILNELTNNPKAQVTFAIAPVMLEEWQTISKGYTLAAANSESEPQDVPADDPVAKKYDLALSSLRAAFERGQVILAPVAYSDPDLPSLVDNDLGEDVEAQYRRGIAVTNSTVTTSTATGTIPFGLTLPTEATEALVENELTWVVVDDTFTKTQDGESASSGVCAIEGNDALTALVNDSKSSNAITEQDAATVLSRAMDRYGDTNKDKGPLITVATVTTDATQTIALEALKTLDSQPWITFSDPNKLATRASDESQITLSQSGALAAPADYWDTVFEARDDARAVEAITEPTSEIPLRATKNSLIAESSAWTEPEGAWEGADRGLSFAKDAIKTAEGVLNAVTLEIQSVTLAKNEGEIPLVVSNSGDESLHVIIEVAGTSGLKISGEHAIEAKLEKNDNFFTIPITLDANSPSGDLHVSIMAGDKAIDSQTVVVKSSMMNRIFMLIAIALVLIGILIYVRRHVKKANEPNEDPQETIEELEVEAGEIPAKETEGTPDANEPKESSGEVAPEKEEDR